MKTTYKNEELKKLAKIDWDKNATLQDEFMGDFEAWEAYFVANKSGHVRIVGQTVV